MLDCLCGVCNPWEFLDDEEDDTDAEADELQQIHFTPLEPVDDALPRDFDARESFIIGFGMNRCNLQEELATRTQLLQAEDGGAATRIVISNELSRKMLKTAREGLEGVGQQAHSARRSLATAMTNYELAIRSQGDLALREQMIAEFQTKKFELGVDAREDRERASSFLSVARGNRGTVRERVGAYQIALIHTNEPSEHRRLMQEYCEFCRRYQ